MTKSFALLTLFSATGLALSLATGPGYAEDPAMAGIIVAADQAAPEPVAPPGPGADPSGAFDPKTYKETPSEVAECEKTWDPQTGMSKEEYEASCKRTLKYFPEK